MTDIFSLSALDFALEYAALGWPVYPCSAGPAHHGKKEKAPLTPRGQKDGSADPAQIRVWARMYPGCLWGAVPGEAGRVVIDLDCKPGAPDGRLTWAQGPGRDAPPTRTIVTPSGGRHLVYRLPEGVTLPPRTGILPGIDIRSAGGNAIIPGGEILSVDPTGAGVLGRYVADGDLPEAELPADILALLSAPAERPRAAPVQAPDALAIAALEALPPVPGGRGRRGEWRNAGFALYGATGGSDAARAAFLAWSLRGDPSGREDDLEKQWESFRGAALGARELANMAGPHGGPAGREASDALRAHITFAQVAALRKMIADAKLTAIASADPAEIAPLLIEAVEQGLGEEALGEAVAAKLHTTTETTREIIEAAQRAAARRAEPVRPAPAPIPHLIPFAAMAAPRPMRPYLIKGLLHTSAVSLIYGPSNSGKSFFVLDLGYHLATGRRWRGTRTTAALVIYVAAEGAGGMAARAQALLRHYGDDPASVAMSFAPGDIDLSSDEGAERLRTYIADMRAAWDAPDRPVLVIVDTLAASIGGGDENSAKDVGDLTSRAIGLTRDGALGAVHVSLIHHTGKDATKGARGSYALFANVDTVLEIAEGEEGAKVMTARKQRDFEDGGTWGFALKRVELGHDEDGDPITSAVVVPVAVVKGEAALKPDSPAAVALGELRRMIKEDGAERVPVEDWKEAARTALADRRPELSRDSVRKMVNRARTDLLSRGLIREADGMAGMALTAAEKAEALAHLTAAAAGEEGSADAR